MLLSFDVKERRSLFRRKKPAGGNRENPTEAFSYLPWIIHRYLSIIQADLSKSGQEGWHVEILGYKSICGWGSGLGWATRDRSRQVGWRLEIQESRSICCVCGTLAEASPLRWLMLVDAIIWAQVLLSELQVNYKRFKKLHKPLTKQKAKCSKNSTSSTVEFHDFSLWNEVQRNMQQWTLMIKQIEDLPKDS